MENAQGYKPCLFPTPSLVLSFTFCVDCPRVFPFQHWFLHYSACLVEPVCVMMHTFFFCSWYAWNIDTHQAFGAVTSLAVCTALHVKGNESHHHTCFVWELSWYGWWCHDCVLSWSLRLGGWCWGGESRHIFSLIWILLLMVLIT